MSLFYVIDRKKNKDFNCKLNVKYQRMTELYFDIDTVLDFSTRYGCLFIL